MRLMRSLFNVLFYKKYVFLRIKVFFNTHTQKWSSSSNTLEGTQGNVIFCYFTFLHLKTFGKFPQKWHGGANSRSG